jgi:hypothetical protein
MAAVPQYPWRPLGELLVGKALLRAEELDDALVEQQRSGRRLGEILVERQLVSAEQLTCVLAEQYGLHLEVDASQADVETPSPAAAEMAPPRPLGRVLLERGVITQEELDFALEAQRRSGRRLGEILVGHGAISWTTVASAVAEQHGVAAVDVAALREVPAPAPPPPSSPSPTASYEVREGAAVLYRSESFLEATDYAFERLEREPAELKILRRVGSEEEEVWNYTAALAEANAAAPSLTQQFGYDVTRWTGPR